MSCSLSFFTVQAISVIIPALNEADGIGSVLAAIKALPLQAEIIVINDGSTDNTADVARHSGATLVLEHPVPAGYGYSLKAGIAAASNEIIVITDADGTYPVGSIPALVDMLNRGFDMVVGARFGKAYRGAFLKMPARIIFKLLVEFTTGKRIPDINSGFRVFRKQDILPFFPDLCNTFSFTTTQTLIYQLTGRFVGYVPVAYEKRVGRSKVRIVRDALRTMQYIVEVIIRYNPLKLFLLLSIVSFGVSIMVSPLIGFVAIFCGFLCSMLIFSLGIIAEALRSLRRVSKSVP